MHAVFLKELQALDETGVIASTLEKSEGKIGWVAYSYVVDAWGQDSNCSLSSSWTIYPSSNSVWLWAFSEQLHLAVIDS